MAGPDRQRSEVVEGETPVREADADQAIAAAMTVTTAPWPDATEIDTEAPPEQTLERAMTAIHARRAGLPRRFRRPGMEPG
ncbi:hypothetical protein [Microbispora sp. H10670]|uniref:hypothetical protein n=1 Tax=Microbispora sp. H10670 TaxID=2729108 RepID=UPI001600F0EC|nr:hypothetical protein [Microbispora sp. H10670]